MLEPNEMQTSYFELKASNNLTWIDSSSEISIIAKNPIQSDAFNTYTLRATIISPFINTQPRFVCKKNSLFPSDKTSYEICQGSMDSCSSRSWNVYLNLTIMNSSNIRNKIHSVVLTYYDNENISQPKKKQLNIWQMTKIAVIYNCYYHQIIVVKSMLILWCIIKMEIKLIV